MATPLTQQTRQTPNAKSPPKVAIIILNWNGWKNTVECLESLYQIDYPNYEILLIDNGSKDGSIQKIQQYTDGQLNVESKFFKCTSSNKPIRLVKAAFSNPQALQYNKELVLFENKVNVGYAAGVNIGVRYAQKQATDYVLLLNNDLVVDKNFLTQMIETAQKNPNIGIAGPTIYYYDRPTTIDFAGENLNLWRVKGREFLSKSSLPREVDKIEGSCMLIRRSLLDKIGLLYPKFWAYWEETDLCFRTKKAGYKVVYLPKPEVWHKVAGSIGGEKNLLRQYYLYRNRLLFARRNLSIGNQAKFLVYFFGFELWLKTAVELKHHEIRGAFTYLKAAKDGLHLYLDPRNLPKPVP
jgi:GT2 family glycosyltransferase